MTGKSLLGIFQSGSVDERNPHREFVFAGKERHTLCREDDLPYPQRSVRDHQFLYIRNLEPDRWPAGSPDTPSVHGWVYGDIDQSPSQTYLVDHRADPDIKSLFEKAMAKRPGEELYDVIDDPACLNNLAGNQVYVKDQERLSRVLDEYLLQTGDPRYLSGSEEWDHFPYYFQNPEGVVPYPDPYKQ